MKKYQVLVAPNAKDDLDRALHYITSLYKNEAQKSAGCQTRDGRLQSHTNNPVSIRWQHQRAGSEFDRRKKGLKRINLLRHSYFMLFMIDGEKVIITNIFHTLEDYENKLK